jgi:hypothetical protein
MIYPQTVVAFKNAEFEMLKLSCLLGTLSIWHGGPDREVPAREHIESQIKSVLEGAKQLTIPARRRIIEMPVVYKLPHDLTRKDAMDVLQLAFEAMIEEHRAKERAVELRKSVDILSTWYGGPHPHVRAIESVEHGLAGVLEGLEGIWISGRLGQAVIPTARALPHDAEPEEAMAVMQGALGAAIHAHSQYRLAFN